MTTTVLPLDAAATTQAGRVQTVARPVPGRRFTVPLAAVVALAAFLTARLSNTAFIDESLYILTGYEYLDLWLHGDPLAEGTGAAFSGAPVLYPVLAATLDALGGLEMVRLGSLVAIVGAMLLVRSTTAAVFGARAGLLAAAVFGLAGPVLYVGHLATFDAWVIFLLAAALRVGVVNSSWRSAVAVGLLLALAVATKYTAAIYVLPVLAAVVVVRRDLTRPIVSIMTVCTVLAGAWAVWGDRVAEAVAFTTTGRSALSPVSTDVLLGLVPHHLAPILILTVFGVVFTATRGRWSWALLAAGLVLTAAALPIAQMRLGELVSFEKHLAYSVLFLAPVAGWGMARWWRLAIATPLVIFVLAILTIWGGVRSDQMYTEWPNVSPVLAALPTSPEPGLYTSSSAAALDYHTQDVPGMAWEPTFGLYAQGEEAIREAVETGRFVSVILRSGSTGSVIVDESQAVFIDALENSDRYVASVVPVENTSEAWVFYTRR